MARTKQQTPKSKATASPKRGKSASPKRAKSASPKKRVSAKSKTALAAYRKRLEAFKSSHSKLTHNEAIAALRKQEGKEPKERRIRVAFARSEGVKYKTLDRPFYFRRSKTGGVKLMVMVKPREEQKDTEGKIKSGEKIKAFAKKAKKLADEKGISYKDAQQLLAAKKNK